MAFEHEPDAIRTALAEITAGRADAVLGDADLALIACWALNDRELPGGGTLAQRYAQQPDLASMNPTSLDASQRRAWGCFASWAHTLVTGSISTTSPARCGRAS